MKKRKKIIIHKKIISICLLFSLLVTFYACSTSKTETHKQKTSSTNTEFTEQDTTTAAEMKTALSDSCDFILAEGKDEDGDVYEIVAMEEITVDSVVRKIGVIKNNKWLIEPTDSIPFLDKQTNNLYGEGYTDSLENISLREGYGPHFYYLQNGCFVTNNFLYNSELNKMKVLNEENENGTKKEFYFDSVRFADPLALSQTDLKIVLKTYKKKSVGYYFYGFEIFDPGTFQTKTINKKGFFSSTGQVNLMVNGLAWVQHFTYDYGQKNFYGFMDENGKLVIDFDKKNFCPTSPFRVCFTGEQCTFTARNKQVQNQKFEVTIDSKGNIVKQSKTN